MTAVANRLNHGQLRLVTQDSSTSFPQCHLYTPPVIVRGSFAERLCVATLFIS